MTYGLKAKLDYDDLAHLPSDGKRYEISEGELRVTPSPSLLHQWASSQLFLQLEGYFRSRGLGHVFYAPLDVILTRHDVFEPDLVVVTERSQMTGRVIEGPPALLVEILSESTAEYDRTTKAKRYAALGVQHYWIVDLQEKTLECYRGRNGVFEAVTTVTGNAELRHPDFPDLIIRTAPLWTIV